MRMHPLLMGGASLGLPRNGLVALYDPYRDVYGRNVLPVGAEDFESGGIWIGNTGVTLTITPNQPAHDGTLTAFRVQSSGGASVVKLKTSVFAMVSGATYQLGIWVKNNTNGSRIGLSNVNTTYETSTDWHFVSDGRVASSATASFYIGTDAAGTDLDVTLELPQLNLGPTLFPYSAPVGAPGTLQTAADYRGGLYPLQLGSGATADAADPAFTGVSMVHAADYLLSGSLAGVTMAGDWTLPIICKTAGTANTLVSLASASAADQYQAIEYNGSTKVRIKTVNGETVTTSDDLTVSATAVQMLVLTSSGDTLTLKRMDTGTSVTATNADPTGTARLCIGALGINVVASAADALEWHYLPLYGRALTAGEQARTYVYLKSLFARRSVTVA